ncbi:hypothetical protein M3650_25540 [Paenibacillus sp. MER TA 81-3]|uniref:hypothetical protein n=1 Tax=Paenibacillus sp. MER TA 81-3 TaxID=2939573 RepID=UPI0020406DE5|nr:hypothetical protein [Paenibacillus sp. MER TA 81-3]MCM3341895.1 hypothetical protein [Paenibacillus sp. MER TA 81-3]
MKRIIVRNRRVRKLLGPWINQNLAVLQCYKLGCYRSVTVQTVMRARKHRGSHRRPHHSAQRIVWKLSLQQHKRLGQLATRRKKKISSSAAIRTPQHIRLKAVSIEPPKRYTKRKSPAKRPTRRRKRIYYAYEKRPAKQTTAAPELFFHRIDPPAGTESIEKAMPTVEEPIAQAPSTAMEAQPVPEQNISIDEPIPMHSDTEPLEEGDTPQPKQSTSMEEHGQDSKMEPIVTQACILFRNEDQEASFTEVSSLEAIWDVGWDQLVQVRWEHEWTDVRYETKLMIQDVRIDEAESAFLWVTGHIRITAIGTTHNSPALRHQMTYIPFSSTVLRPLSETRLSTPEHCDELPPYHASIRAEAGDWHVKVVLEPDQADARVSEGMIHVSGRVWWFRKQLIPWRK